MDYPGEWNLTERSIPDIALTCMYFVFTTITTIGLGDYYPVNDEERLIWSFILLGGVALFSFFMGFLLEMIMKVKDLDKNFEDEE